MFFAVIFKKKSVFALKWACMRAIKPIFKEKRALFSNLSLLFCVFNWLLLKLEYDKINKLKKK